MIADRIIIILSLASLIGFCGVVMYYVAEPDLIIIMGICLGIAVYDFWVSVFAKKPDAKE